jgi:hypothetical protein
VVDGGSGDAAVEQGVEVLTDRKPNNAKHCHSAMGELRRSEQRKLLSVPSVATQTRSNDTLERINKRWARNFYPYVLSAPSVAI